MRTFLLLSLILLAISCKKEDNSSALEYQTGKNEYNMEIDGETRNFLIHVPASYTGNTEVPLFFMLHGTSGDGTKFYNISRWVEKADQENFIAVFPTALKYDLTDGTRKTKWSSGGLVNDVPPGTVIKDDVPFINELVELCKETFSINDRRVYITGFSNGGGFVKSVVVPRMGNVFTAACSSGGPGTPQTYAIQGGRTMPFYNITGTKDPKVWESIGSNDELPISATDIENHDYIWNTLTNMCDMLGLDTTYTEEPHIPDYNLLIFDQPATSDASEEYVFMMIKNMAHNFPNGGNNPQGVVGVDVLYPWFMQFER